MPISGSTSNAASDSSAPSVGPAPPRRQLWLAAALIAVAAFAAWHNSFEVPFVLDDLYNIETNPTIRRLSALGEVLSPPTASGVGGRPLLNLSFALNYAPGGFSVTGYHALNLAIHVLAGLTLLGLVRRTLLAPGLRDRFGSHALPIATAAALLWTLHPIQTASVTYLSQRAESLMGLCYLLTLYCFARATFCHPLDDKPAGPGRVGWLAGAVLSCAAGMGVKEVILTAPFTVLLFDRTFVAGTFRAALTLRRWFYLALAATWLPLPFVMTSAAERGVGTERGVAWTTYALTQSRELLEYLRLSVWPHPLIFDRGAEYLRTASDAAPYALLLVPLLAATAFAVRRWPAAGFLPAWFFIVLAPTSSVVPVAFLPLAENRLYLPLAAVAVAAALALHRFAGRRVLLVALVPAVAGGAATVVRNRDFRSELTLWADTVAQRPGHPHAHYNLGLALSRAGRPAAAAAHWRATLREDPHHAPAHENLANALVSLGRIPEALSHYEAALRHAPDFPVARANYGLVLLYLGRVPEAEQHLRLAIRQAPDNAGAHTNYGLVLDRLGRSAEAVLHYQTALRLDPNFADAHHNLGVAYTRADRLPEATAEFETVARLRPKNLDAQLNVARAYLQAGRHRDAHARAEQVLTQFPDAPEAHLLLGNTLAHLGQLAAAVVEYERALALRPDYPDARQNLAQLRARLR
ncbi:MAG: tetratricopeptide repeat protein [Verrucomicrobia bacterium]|nr:tetratricopeptide repeat protein [Verrucomicrobiota bacterium]